MRHRAHLLLATAALAAALAPVVVTDRPTPPGLIRGTQSVRHALMEAGQHFYRLSDIIGGINWHHQLTL
ncbi:hypothetical protein [Nonomuraea gerenzanensis]|uniref:Uncharacterized protein n=1 Tax=Nonomuraea gerenzanensis TaxID=93944 RepID=A0A1M4EJA1_9ACTN|nr:hypothetical protein [Nonomuraea gerenzanensis]UBU10515.1 hypothetical protein LCN96_40220 [Nonomuraea gerenzanensis]SBO98920.1 hypothetical protein BN4615_P8436 [Nonomuraea gerenzanensis]